MQIFAFSQWTADLFCEIVSKMDGQTEGKGSLKNDHSEG